MARGVDVVVATPGRLLDHLTSGVVHLGDTDIVVLDEADQMLDLGFMPAIRRILAKVQSDRQTVLLSATMPASIRRLADEFLSDPLEISVAPAARPIELIDQKAMYVDRPAKRQALIDILAGRDVERAIVFTRTRRGADKVNQHLQKAGLVADALHGNKSQEQRQRTLAGFRSGRVKVLVATDIAARGIDVDDVSHVVNYELPDVPEAYVHRIGRTARAGKSGIAVSLYDSSERAQLRDIERLIGRSLNGSSGHAASSVQGSGGRGSGKASPKGSEGPAAEGAAKRRGRVRRRRGKPEALNASTGGKSSNHRRPHPNRAVDRQAQANA